MAEWLCMGKLQSACEGWRYSGAENDLIASALSTFFHFPALGVWLHGLKAKFNSAAVWPGKAIWKVSAHLGAAFKLSVSSLVTAWATLQPWPSSHVTHWSCPWHTDCTSWLDVRPVSSFWACLTIWTLDWTTSLWLDLLRSPCSGTVALSPWQKEPASPAVTLSSQLAFPDGAVSALAARW